MKLIVQGKQMRVGAWLREYAEKHVVQRLRRFADSSAAVLRIEMGRPTATAARRRSCT